MEKIILLKLSNVPDGITREKLQEELEAGLSFYGYPDILAILKNEL